MALPGPPQATDSTLQTSGCDFAIPAGLDVTCSQLTVLEDRHSPTSPLLHLAVATVHTTSSSRKQDPILWVNGGYGGRTIDYAMGFLASHPPLFVDRDIIVLDERGTGYSEPDLSCFEMEQAAVDGLTEDVPAQVAASVAAAQRCHDRLIAAHDDLAAFSSSANIADLEDLRRAMGIGSWNLFGVSSGTRQALGYLRQFPEHVRSLVLDSVAPPGVDDAASYAPDAARAIDLLFQLCARDVRCAGDHPQLDGTFETAIRELDQSPRRLTFDDVFTGDKRVAVAYGSTLIWAVFDGLYDYERIPRLPSMIEDAMRGGTELLEWELSLEGRDDKADAVYLEAFCGDSFDYTTEARIRAAAVGIRPSVATTFPQGPIGNLAECQAFGRPQSEPSLRAAVKSDVPALLISGELDPITPPSWSEQVATTLAHGQRLLFPGVGHGVIGTTDCSIVVTQAFLAAPLTPVPLACLANVSEPMFAP